MNLKEKYGNLALIAGASEGIGAAYARYLASQGIDLILIARRKEPLEKIANELIKIHQIRVTCLSSDLADLNATSYINQELKNKNINILVYNAALSYIGAFEKNTSVHNAQIATANILTPMHLVQLYGEQMLQQKKGAIILMASLAGFQGSGFLAVYAASKAFNRVFAESLWYEWRNRGVDVIACCAGATATPNFINTKPEKASLFAPKVQTPDEVVNECFRKLGKQASFVTGNANKFASFIMQKIMPRKMAIKIMGDTTKKMYRL